MRTAVATFDPGTRTFPGSKAEQARFLLRHVRPLANVDANLAVLPETLAAMLGDRLPPPQALKEPRRALIASELL
jgi:hypothetical protein